MSDFEYRRGLTFRSPYLAYQYIVRPLKHVYAQDGTVIDTIPELLCEFGVLGEEWRFTNEETSESEVGVDMRGHFFDLDQQAEDKGWSDDDRALVARVLLKNQAKFAGEYQLHSARPVPAPWPTYDSTPHGKIADLAASLGLAAEALAYEKQNKNRSTVVAGLQEELVKAQVADDLVAA